MRFFTALNLLQRGTDSVSLSPARLTYIYPRLCLGFANSVVLGPLPGHRTASLKTDRGKTVIMMLKKPVFSCS